MLDLPHPSVLLRGPLKATLIHAIESIESWLDQPVAGRPVAVDPLAHRGGRSGLRKLREFSCLMMPVLHGTP
jgi:hypothetical protein